MSQDRHDTASLPTDQAARVWAEERAAIQARIDEAIHQALTAPRAAWTGRRSPVRSACSRN